MCYLQGTKVHGIMYNRTIFDNLKRFCDTNFTRDQSDCKSHTLGMFSLLDMEP